MIINRAMKHGTLQKCLEKKIEREIVSSLFVEFILLLAPIKALYATMQVLFFTQAHRTSQLSL